MGVAVENLKGVAVFYDDGVVVVLSWALEVFCWDVFYFIGVVLDFFEEDGAETDHASSKVLSSVFTGYFLATGPFTLFLPPLIIPEFVLGSVAGALFSF